MRKPFAKTTKKHKVFFIDDHQPFLEMYCKKFEECGFWVGTYQTSAKHSVDQLIDCVRTNKPDMIFLDLVMEGTDGLNVLRKLKSTIETKWIPVVMLSNIDNPGDQEECKRLGASQFLVKVRFSPSELVEYAQGVMKIL